MSYFSWKKKKERGRKEKNASDRERERWRIPKDATPSDWAAVLGGSRASPNYSCLVTSRGRRWRSSPAGTINQRRLAYSQGDWREVFKAGEDRSGKGCQRRAAYAASPLINKTHREALHLLPTCRLALFIIKTPLRNSMFFFFKTF